MPDNAVTFQNRRGEWLSARLIFETARHPKSFLSLHQADHLLSRRNDAPLAGEMIASWAAPYLGRDQAASWQADIADNRTVVRTETGLRTEAMSSGFGLILDEPQPPGPVRAPHRGGRPTRRTAARSAARDRRPLPRPPHAHRHGADRNAS